MPQLTEWYEQVHLVDLDRPLAAYVPGFRQPEVLAAFDAERAARTDLQQELNTRIDNALGDFNLELAGVAFFSLGVIFATWSAELASLLS